MIICKLHQIFSSVLRRNVEKLLKNFPLVISLTIPSKLNECWFFFKWFSTIRYPLVPKWFVLIFDVFFIDRIVVPVPELPVNGRGHWSRSWVISCSNTRASPPSRVKKIFLSFSVSLVLCLSLSHQNCLIKMSNNIK